MGLVQVLTTVESREQALDLAHAAIDAHEAACVQIIGPIISVFRWDGKVEETAEFLLLLKAPEERIGRLMGFVRDHHPYDTPEITAIESSLVDDRYLAWAKSETVGTGSP